MPLLKYKAVDPRGKIYRGFLEATNADDLELRLMRLDLMLIRYYASDGESEEGRKRFFARDGVTRNTLILFCIHMAPLLRSGVSIVDAMEEIRASIPHPRFNNVVASIIEDITSGKALSSAMLAYPAIFPPLFSGLIKVGERTGKLEEIFDNLATNLKWEDELLAQTSKALRYPLFVGIMVLGLFFFLMTYLAPRLISFLPEMGATLPFHTKILIAVSDFVIHWWPLLIFMPIAVYIGSNFACRVSPAFHLKQDHFFLRVWFFGPLMRKIHLVRFANAFALMYRSGIPVLDAMEMTGNLTNNRAIQTSILEAKQKVSDGFSVSASFQDSRLFPPPIPRLLQVGEKAGQLDSALMNVSYFLDREVRESIGNIQSLIEPVLTLFVGSLLAWVILSVLGPIYDVITQVQF